MIIKFKNWEKYQTRKDVKHTHWFKLENQLFSDPKMYALNPEEFQTFIYLLCEASKSNKSGEFFLIREHYRIHNRLQDRVLDRTLSKLQSLQIIEQPTLRGRYVRVDDMCPRIEEKRIEERRGEENILPDSAKAEPRQVFDFDSLYKKYPRKEGKSRGMITCKSQIKTLEDFNLLSNAIDRYAEHCSKSGTEGKYIKHFSSFMSSWRDWLDPETGMNSEKSKNSELNWKYIFGDEDKNGS